MNAPEFRLRPQRADDGDGHPLVVAVHGEIDTTNASRFYQDVRELLSSRPVVMDLSRTDFFDSAAFAALDRLLAEGPLGVVMSPDSLLRKAAVILRVPVHDDVDSARAWFGEG